MLGVFTAADFAGVNPLFCAMPAAGAENHIPPHPIVAADTARHRGDVLAVVVAEDSYTAHEAVNLIEVEAEPLPVVVDAEQAMQPGAPQLHAEIPNNICMH